MPSGDHFLMGAGVLIQHDDGRVLLVHHAKTGRWVIPGGKAEPGETPRQCAVREAREETGLDGRPGRLLAVQHLTADRHWGNKYIADPYELFVFALHTDPDQHAGIRVPDGELLGWDWFTPDDGVKLMDPTNEALFMAVIQAVANGTCAYLEDLQALE
ncbi:NUDIX domain-containing protein [Streptomyces griseocarneus]|uniref:NUDIX domain-containing protein n=1 Tax=Streptomyces griseocarneus TaxID=51201 RepID=UPI00167D0D8C|nr:NUDIX hydrolase [Streptomyces griseocarneus]MBZ6476709.1 NUDIX hydrolase [Streptomyces griseocarneus]GHG80467.1 hypothetical protein GCM10018779_62050 [Streptomyces griseocarneus]